MTEEYTETALHFEAARLPQLLERYLPAGPLAFADIGCGDGPLFATLTRGGFIGPQLPVYAVDLAPARLARVAVRFPWIETVVASADAVPAIADASLDFVCSTMVGDARDSDIGDRDSEERDAVRSDERTWARRIHATT